MPPLNSAINLLIDLASGTPGRFALAKGALDLWKNYTQTREIEGLHEFLSYMAEQVGDIHQLLSDPYLKTEEGQRFAHKIIAAAVDPTLAEKRQLFANALINGVRHKEFGDFDRLRFVDLLIKLSAVSLVQLAEIHKRCEIALLQGRHPEWESVGLYPDGKPRTKFPADSDVHFTDATLRELRSVGLLGKIRYGREKAGTLKAIVISTEANYYNAFSRAFSRFIAAPEQSNDI